MLNESGISSEPIDDFAKRNKFVSSPKFPQDLKNGKEVRFSNQLPFLPILGFENADWDKMYCEADQLRQHYVPHRHQENHKGWNSLCIHGLSSVHTEAHHTYGYNDIKDAPFRWTDLADWCPTIRDFFKNQFDYNDYYRIRIMKLDPGGYIIPHKDSLTLGANHIGPTNIALNNPTDCNFYMEDIGILPFQQGSVIKLNLYNVHAVYNCSNEPRYHIIVHGRMGSSWYDKIYNSYLHWKKMYA